MAKKVLIADDEPNIVTSLEFLMTRSGYDVKVARTGEEALALVASFAPDLVLLDVMMPQRSGYEVRTVANGAEALAALEADRPDVVLLDIMMPVKSGYEVCQRMRERPEWRDIKIVVVSAKGREAEVSKGLSLGADAYVTKPFSNRELIARVAELLGESRAPGAA